MLLVIASATCTANVLGANGIDIGKIPNANSACDSYINAKICYF